MDGLQPETSEFFLGLSSLMQVDEEFAAMVECDQRLRDNWRGVRDKVLTYAASLKPNNSDVTKLLASVDDDEFDEGTYCVFG